MTPHYADDRVKLYAGDCLDVLAGLPDASVDSVCTDPPYGLANTTPEQVADTLVRWVNGERDYIPKGAGFMGRSWDAFVPPVAVWDECLRVLKPGGHVLCFAGSRTQDLMGLSLRLAGFEIRDSIAWLYGSGFPKSLDVSKAIDKAAGAEREVVGANPNGRNVEPLRYGGDNARPNLANNPPSLTAHATDAARTWAGWGTALKPAHEPIILARKPLVSTVAGNVLQYGTGALNVDGCRIEGRERTDYCLSGATRTQGATFGVPSPSADFDASKGRWPANVVLDEDQAAALDQMEGGKSVNPPATWKGGTGTTEGWGNVGKAEPGQVRGGFGDSGGASRFFYVAKAPKSERPVVDGTAHPTVKPLTLMRWLARLITPPGGTLLEPFAGSGTTVEAGLLEGFNVVAIEREDDYLPLVLARIERANAVKTITPEPDLFDLLGGESA